MRLTKSKPSYDVRITSKLVKLLSLHFGAGVWKKIGIFVNTDRPCRRQKWNNNIIIPTDRPLGRSQSARKTTNQLGLA